MGMLPQGSKQVAGTGSTVGSITPVPLDHAVGYVRGSFPPFRAKTIANWSCASFAAALEASDQRVPKAKTWEAARKAQ